MSRKGQKLLAYLSILIVSFFFIFLRQDSVKPVKKIFVEGLSAPIRIVSFPFKELKKILYYHRTFEEFRKLGRQVDTLKARLVGFDERVMENTRLKDLVGLKKKTV